MKIAKVTSMTAGTGEITMDYAEKTFQELLAFQGYGFCLGYDSEVETEDRGRIPLARVRQGDMIDTPEGWSEVLAVMPQGFREVFRIHFSNGMSLSATLDHRMLCEDGELRPIKDLFPGGPQVQCAGPVGPARVTEVVFLGNLPAMDISVSNSSHVFYANGLAVSNCKAHATCYSVYSAVQMWLQQHYFKEYMCALLSHIDRAKEKKGHQILQERVEYCIKNMSDGTIRYPTVNSYDSEGRPVRSDKWIIRGPHLVAPIKNIKEFSDREVGVIYDCNGERPFSDLADFLDRTKMNENRFLGLLYAHALDEIIQVDGDKVSFGYNWYMNERKSRPKPPADECLDLFGDPAESSSSGVSGWVDVREFSKQELDDLCMDMNGFVIPENIRVKYAEFFEKGMVHVEELTGNSEYGTGRQKIYRISEIFSEKIPDGSYRRIWMLGKVTSEARNIPSKYGSTFDKITVSDGCDSLQITGRIPSQLSRGVTAVFPISASSGGKVYVDDRKLNKIDMYILDRQQ